MVYVFFFSPKLRGSVPAVGSCWLNYHCNAGPFCKSIPQCLSALLRMEDSHTGVGVAAGSDQHGALAFVRDAMHISKAFSIMHESSLSFGNTSSELQVVLIKSFPCVRSQECKPRQ